MINQKKLSINKLTGMSSPLLQENTHFSVIFIRLLLPTWGQTYANNEAAFQAQKTCCAKEQQQFSIFRLHNPAEAKKRGKKLTLRPDWDKVKIFLMYEICMCKFMQNPELRDALLATGNSLLIEGNTWGDYFWGKVNGHGENHLGLILMDVREKLKWSMEMENEIA